MTIIDFVKPRGGGRYKADELRKLTRLRKGGILTPTEFDRRKGRLLGRSGGDDDLDRGSALVAEALEMLAEPTGL